MPSRARPERTTSSSGTTASSRFRRSTISLRSAGGRPWSAGRSATSVVVCSTSGAVRDGWRWNFKRVVDRWLRIDPSPGAVDVARRRGVRDVRLMRLEDVDASLGQFGTVLMYGNNFGLFGSRSKARRLLRTLRPLADRIVAGSNDLYRTDDPVHLAYQEHNRRRGRMPGQLRIRVRYGNLIDPWFTYLLASPDDVTEIVDGTGWRIRAVRPR